MRVKCYGSTAISKIAGRGSIPRTLANERIMMKDLLKKLSQALASIGLIFIVALLGAIAGQGPKMLRRFILPSVVTIYAYFMLQNWWVLTCYLMTAPLSIGYGIPEKRGFFIVANENYKIIEEPDEGSAIGAFFFKLFKQSELWANVFTRGFVGLLISLTMLSIPILKGTWISFLVGSAMIVGIWGAVSWRGLGETKVKIFGKEYALLNDDLIVYAVTACAIVLMVNGWVG